MISQRKSKNVRTNAAYSRWLVVVGTCVLWHHPLIDYASTRLDTMLRHWWHGVTLIEDDINTRGGVVWIIRSFSMGLVVG